MTDCPTCLQNGITCKKCYWSPEAKFRRMLDAEDWMLREMEFMCPEDKNSPDQEYRMIFSEDKWFVIESRKNYKKKEKNMNDADDAFAEAEDEFDQKFGDQLIEMKYDQQALEDLAGEGPDLDKLKKLTVDLKAAENAEQAKAAWINFTTTAGAVLVEKAIKVIRG